jgi:hypothetical protein
MDVGNDVTFTVQHKTAFELPLSSISNSNIAGKNEVALEFNPPPPSDSQRPPDELVEMRFYVPGKSMKSKGSDAGSEEETDLDEEGNEISAAEAMHNLIKDKADIGAVTGDSIVVFEETLVLTPRYVKDNVDYATRSLWRIGVDSRSNSSKSRFGYLGKAQTTGCHSATFIASSFFPKLMTCISNLSSASTHLSGKVPRGILSLSLNGLRTKRWMPNLTSLSMYVRGLADSIERRLASIPIWNGNMRPPLSRSSRECSNL